MRNLKLKELELKIKFYADFEELQLEDGNNSIWTTMYFAIQDRIDPEYDYDTMYLVETANENALNMGIISDIEELGERSIYKEISDTVLKNIRSWWKENIEEIYLSKIPKYIKSEMPKGIPTYEDAERIADKGAAMFYGEFEKKFLEYLNIIEGGFAKGYAKGGKINNKQIDMKNFDREIYNIILIHTTRTWERIRVKQPFQEMPYDNIDSTDCIQEIATRINDDDVIQEFLKNRKGDIWIDVGGASDTYIEHIAEKIITTELLIKENK